MLKWGEFTEGETLYEAFHPESDKDGGSWLIRVVLRGHVVAERHVPMLYRPTFGPDIGDVAALEAALDQLIGEVKNQAIPHDSGPYVALSVQIESPDPMLHATCYALLEQFPAASRDLGMPLESIAKLLSLPEGWTVEDLYPVAVTAERQARIRRVLALKSLADRHPHLTSHMPALIEALPHDDVAGLQRELQHLGVDLAPMPSTGEK